MKVSVVVCTYSPERFDDFAEAVESIHGQTYDPVEIVLVSDGNERLYERIKEKFGNNPNVIIHCNDKNRGISYSRTKGAELASGDVVAFIDDDAVARPDWIEQLVAVYKRSDALAVGGRMTGRWVDGRPWYLPEEFDWLVGVTHRGFASAGEEVRNTFESNISFRREIFLELGGFDPELGPTAEEYRHSEGAEIGARLQNAYGKGVIYEPDAVVEHKVFEHRTCLRWLCKRAFEQGVSKRTMECRTTSDSREEIGFLHALFTEHVPRRVREFIRNPSVEAIGQLVMLFGFTGLVGGGYVYEGVIRQAQTYRG